MCFIIVIESDKEQMILKSALFIYNLGSFENLSVWISDDLKLDSDKTRQKVKMEWKFERRHVYTDTEKSVIILT